MFAGQSFNVKERQLPKNKQYEKVILPQDSNMQQPLDYRSTALQLELERISPHKLYLDYLNSVL